MKYPGSVYVGNFTWESGKMTSFLGMNRKARAVKATKAVSLDISLIEISGLFTNNVAHGADARH